MKRWKSSLIVLVFIALTVFGMQTVFADESGKCGDNVTWTLDSGYTLTISGTGQMYNYGSNKSPWDHSTSVVTVIVEDGVTSIGDNTFVTCWNLSSVTLPSSLTTIGSCAFSGCMKLTSVNVPSSVKSIGSEAFSGCSSLTSMALPRDVTSIEDHLFSHCTALTSIIIPSSVKRIGEYAFYSCSSLTSVTIPLSVTNLGNYAFSDCSNLTSVTIPSSMTSIGHDAFSRCIRLASVMIPSSVINIGDAAFWGCTSLVSVTIPSNVTSLGKDAFGSCSNLANIKVSSSNNIYTSIDGVLFNKNETKLICCPGGKSGAYTIPSSVTNILEMAFGDCTRLTNIEIPLSVKSISRYAFFNCAALRTVTIPSSMTSISEYTFSRCSALTSVSIPSSVKSIDTSAFHLCESLTDIYYGGSEEDWNKGFSGLNYPAYLALEGVTLHYNSTDNNNGNKKDTDDLKNSPIIPYTYQGYKCLFDVNYFSKNNPSYIEHQGLEALSGILSWAVYNDGDKEPLKKVLNTFGFSDSDIFEPGKREDSFHYAIAKRKIVVDKKKYNLLLLCIRGTVTPIEKVGDALTKPDTNFLGYNAYGLVAEFAKTVMMGLDDYCDVHPDLFKLPLKVLITGHSLGGATANLLAAKFNKCLSNEDWRLPMIIRDDIYAYTFASIDSIDTKKPVSSGFENIHNITNFYDSYGPDGWPVFTAAGNTRYGKFGHVDIFYSNVDHGAPGAYQNHQMNTYLDAVVNGKVEGSYLRRKENRIASFHCPVDICVYNGNKLVGKVIDNKVVMESVDTPICVVNEEKYIALLDDGIYFFKITATGDGTMRYYVSNASDGTIICSFDDVVLNDKKTFTTSVGNSVPAQEIKLYVTNDKGENISEVKTNGSEKSIYDEPEKVDQIGGNSQTSSGGLTVGTTESGNGNQPEGNMQPSSEGEPTTEAQPVTPETVLEPITISRVPSSVKVKVRKNKVTVSWKKIKKSKKTKALLAQIKNIQIQYSTDPTFNQNPVAKTIGKNKTEVVLKLKKKTTYYIRLRYVGKDGFSNWSKVKKVKMK